MFKCEFCDGQSVSGDGCKLVVTEWRAKTYQAVSLPKKDGERTALMGSVGVGFEPAVVKRSCPRCDAKDAMRPGD